MSIGQQDKSRICIGLFCHVGLGNLAGSQKIPVRVVVNALPLLADRKLQLSCRSDSAHSESIPIGARPHSVQESLLGHHCNLPNGQGP